MKTKILIAFILLFSFGASCTPDELPNTDCNCGIITEKIVLQIPNNVFTKIKVKNNCDNTTKDIQLTGNRTDLVTGQEYCND